MERIANKNWSDDCISNKKQFQSILAKSTHTKLNVYTCDIVNLTTIGNATYPWQYKEDSVHQGVLIHWATLPGGILEPFAEGDNLVHEVSI